MRRIFTSKKENFSQGRPHYFVGVDHQSQQFYITKEALQVAAS